MVEYGQPDWVNPQNNNNTAVVSEANVAPGVIASANGGYVLLRVACCVSIHVYWNVYCIRLQFLNKEESLFRN
jgi:hypothetical protein